MDADARGHGHLEVVQLLLDRGADPNARIKVSIHRHPDLSATEIYVQFSFNKLTQVKSCNKCCMYACVRSKAANEEFYVYKIRRYCMYVRYYCECCVSQWSVIVSHGLSLIGWRHRPSHLR